VLRLGFLCLALAACAAPVDAPSDEVPLTGRRFFLADDERPLSREDARTMSRALDKLARVARTAATERRRTLAAETLARIEAGDVRLGSIEGSRGIDRFHMCKDFALSVCEGPPPPADDRTWLGDEALGRKLERELDGYQWGNRLYFAITRSTDPDALATTLVHEVNHVAHRSECSYYTDLDAHVLDGDKAYVEEFRAYVAECFFVRDTTASLETCTEYAARAVDAYGFAHERLDPRALTEAILAGERGRLVPVRERWPTSFGACE